MPYVAKHLLCGPGFCHYQGQPIVGATPAQLKQWVTDEMVTLIGDPESVMPGVEALFSDALSKLDQAGLIEVYKLNNLAKFFTPMTSWSDEQFRGMIRQFVALEDLILPDLPSSQKSLAEQMIIG